MTSVVPPAPLKPRDYSFDNIRALLIFLVVFCHMGELFQSPVISRIYELIYVFHVPCLFFVSGYFAKFDGKKVVRHLLAPYLVFHLLYRIFDCVIIHPEKTFVFQITHPYWHMWYLLALTWCFLLIPLLSTSSRRAAAGILGILTALALYAGTDEEVSYSFAASRTMVFLPAFFAGYYAGSVFAPDFLEKIRRYRWILAPVCLALILAFTWYAWQIRLPYKLLFGTYPYEQSGGNLWLRLLILGMAMVWMVLLLALSPNRRIPVITAIGQRTMPIYLLHAFVQRLLQKHQFFHFSPNRNLLAAFLITWVLLLVFSLKPIDKLFRRVF